MNSRNKYTRSHAKGKVIATIMTVILLIIIALGVLDLYGVFDQDGYEPDITIPMTNTHVGWLQTYHAGAWGCAE